MDPVKIHLAINHVAIVAAMAGTFVLVFGWAKNSINTVAAACWLFIVGGAIGIATYLSGEQAEEIAHDKLGLSEEYIHLHEDVATYTLVSYAILAVLSLITLLKLNKSTSFSKGLVTVTLIAALATSGLAMYTGNIGGKIRHTELRSGEMPTKENSNDAHSQSNGH